MHLFDIGKRPTKAHACLADTQPLLSMLMLMLLLHRYCQLMCERGPSREFAAAGAFNDPGSPEGNAWSMWKETLKNMGGVGV
jgi:hypothetical protein